MRKGEWIMRCWQTMIFTQWILRRMLCQRRCIYTALWLGTCASSIYWWYWRQQLYTSIGNTTTTTVSSRRWRHIQQSIRAYIIAKGTAMLCLNNKTQMFQSTKDVVVLVGADRKITNSLECRRFLRQQKKIIYFRLIGWEQEQNKSLFGVNAWNN